MWGRGVPHCGHGGSLRTLPFSVWNYSSGVYVYCPLVGARVVPSHPSPVPFCFACSIDFYTVDITASWNVYSGKTLLTVALSPGHSPPGDSGLGMRLC